MSNADFLYETVSRKAFLLYSLSDPEIGLFENLARINEFAEKRRNLWKAVKSDVQVQKRVKHSSPIRKIEQVCEITNISFTQLTKQCKQKLRQVSLWRSARALVEYALMRSEIISTDPALVSSDINRLADLIMPFKKKGVNAPRPQRQRQLYNPATGNR